MNVECSSISRYPVKRLKKRRIVSRVNSLIVPVCCTILTYVHNYVNIVTVDYLLSCLVKLVKIYSFFSILPVILILVNKRLSNCKRLIRNWSASSAVFILQIVRGSSNYCRSQSNSSVVHNSQPASATPSVANRSYT